MVTNVPEELLRLKPSDLEKVRVGELKRIRRMAERCLIFAESDVDRTLLRGVIQMVVREMERRLVELEAQKTWENRAAYAAKRYSGGIEVERLEA